RLRADARGRDGGIAKSWRRPSQMHRHPSAGSDGARTRDLRRDRRGPSDYRSCCDARTVRNIKDQILHLTRWRPRLYSKPALIRQREFGFFALFVERQVSFRELNQRITIFEKWPCIELSFCGPTNYAIRVAQEAHPLPLNARDLEFCQRLMRSTQVVKFDRFFLRHQNTIPIL